MLAACAEPQSETMPATPDEATARDTCGAAAYRASIGRNASELDVQPGARVIAPDSEATLDFVPDRLNFIVDANGVVTELRCY